MVEHNLTVQFDNLFLAAFDNQLVGYSFTNVDANVTLYRTLVLSDR